MVYWSLGNTLFRYDIAQAEAREEEQKQAKEEKEKEEDTAVALSETSSDTTEEDEIEDYQAVELDVIVKAKRAIAQGTLVLKNAHIISMKGEEIIENGTVVVKNNRIQSVGKSIDVPTGAKVIDLEGKYLVPGFVDTHAHMWPSWGYKTPCMGLCR